MGTYCGDDHDVDGEGVTFQSITCLVVEELMVILSSIIQSERIHIFY